MLRCEYDMPGYVCRHPSWKHRLELEDIVTIQGLRCDVIEQSNLGTHCSSVLEVDMPM
jgi:hypothetical protein